MRVSSTRAAGLLATAVTGLVLVATSPPPRGAVDSVTMRLDGGCGAGTSVVSFTDDSCRGSVSNVFGSATPWTITRRASCDALIRDETFEFAEPVSAQRDGGLPTADGGTRRVQPTDELRVTCRATPDDGGHAVECTWRICSPGSTVACVTEPRCSGRLEPAP
ncbi:MAG: hypothetical protein INH41_14225 [Myxococcaceae bacterium]|jgi:hypothetical protein|nr:hypothetical protein [Myxococcaceae bacterium]MCA3013535.1 hypothetical protein [Myxococcaceae bacterium]